MADRIVRWFHEGKVSTIRTEFGGTYYMDADYEPLWVNLTARRASSGSRPIKVDILDDGETIFNEKPALNSQVHKHWTTIPADVIREGSILKCNRDQIAEGNDAEDLTVELGLRKVSESGEK